MLEVATTPHPFGWSLFPFPPSFWETAPHLPIQPRVAYIGPVPQSVAEARLVERFADAQAFVYVISDDDEFDVLYVGKTVELRARLTKHRHQKAWWPTSGGLHVLAVEGETREEAGASALLLEAHAIRSLGPIYNIVGVA